MLVQVNYLQKNLSMKNYVYYRNNNTNKKSSTLNTPTGHTETNPVIVIRN